MPYEIPFHRETFRPICIPDNQDSPAPVEFEISAVGGPGRARLKSIIVATSGLAQDREWSEAVQQSVIASFEHGAPVFAEAVEAIRNLTVPGALAQKVGLIPAGTPPPPSVPITSGAQFARVCGYFPLLAFEVALAIARLCAQAEVDPRFFAWLSTSSPVGTPPTPPTTARAARARPAGAGTAGSRTRQPASGASGTSRTPPSGPAPSGG
jgi:hypothetical protein